MHGGTINSETRAMARSQLAGRIDAIGRELAHMSSVRLAFAIDDIRRDARESRFEAVAALAGGLERAIATSAGTAVVMPFLEAMGEAVECDDAGSADAWLGAVGARFVG